MKKNTWLYSPYPLLLLAVFSCSSERSRLDTADDGVPVVHTDSLPKHEGPLFDVRTDLILGIDDGEPEWQLFSGLYLALVAPDGRMYIPDLGRGEIFIVRASGDLQKRVGREGAGPGEFRSIGGMFWMDRGREFWVYDRNLVRFNCYTADGDFIRAQSIGQQGQYYWFAPLSGRRLLGLEYGSMARGENNKYSVFSEDMQVIRGFIEVPPQQMWHDEKLGGWGMIFYTVLDGVVTFPDGRILSYHPYLPRITIYTPEGEPVLHIDHHWDLPRVTNEEKESVRSLFRDHPGNANFRHWATDMPIPDTHAAFDLVILDDSDRIWARRTGTKRTRTKVLEHIFDLFNSSGAWLGAQELPYEPLVIQGDFVYSTYQTESESPRFVRLRLVPNNGASSTKD